MRCQELKDALSTCYRLTRSAVNANFSGDPSWSVFAEYVVDLKLWNVLEITTNRNRNFLLYLNNLSDQMRRGRRYRDDNGNTPGFPLLQAMPDPGSYSDDVSEILTWESGLARSGDVTGRLHELAQKHMIWLQSEQFHRWGYWAPDLSGSPFKADVVHLPIDMTGNLGALSWIRDDGNPYSYNGDGAKWAALILPHVKNFVFSIERVDRQGMPDRTKIYLLWDDTELRPLKEDRMRKDWCCTDEVFSALRIYNFNG